MLLCPVDGEEMDKRVYQYWDHESGWRWDAFVRHLPAKTLVKLASMRVRPETTGKDRFVWEEGRGKFTVKTAYKLSMD